MSVPHWTLMLLVLCFAVALRGADDPKPAPAPAPAGEKEKADNTPIRVLFVGDELTEKGHVGQLVTRMAQHAKEPRRFYSEDVGSSNSTLERHAKGDAFWRAMGDQRWDAVVLQEDTRVLQRYPGSTTRFARELDRSIRKRRAQTVIFSAWPAQEPAEGHEPLIKANEELAAAIRAKVLPVGAAWLEASKSAKDIPLYLADKRYASPQGEYLTACVIYAFFYDKSPEGLPADIRPGVKAEEAKGLQQIAWKAVMDQKNAKPKPAEPEKPKQ